MKQMGDEHKLQAKTEEISPRIQKTKRDDVADETGAAWISILWAIENRNSFRNSKKETLTDDVGEMKKRNINFQTKNCRNFL